MMRRIFRVMTGVAASALIVACSQSPQSAQSAAVDAGSVQVEGSYRVEHGLGGAAGHYALGRIDLAEGRTDAAILRFRTAIQIDPQHFEAHNALGVAYGEQGRFPEAIAVLRDAVTRSPYAPHLLNNLGYALMKTGRLQEAGKTFEHALALDVANDHARHNLAAVAAMRGDPVTRSDTVPAPRAVPGATAQTASSAYEVLTPRANDGRFVAVGPNVYEYRMNQAAPVTVQAPAQARKATIAQAPLAADRPAPPRPISQDARPQSPAKKAAASLRPDARAASLRQRSARVTRLPEVAAVRVERRQGSALQAADSRPVASSLARTRLKGVEVSNGAGTRLLARKTAGRLARQGVGVSRLSWYEKKGVERTQIQYRSAFREAAESLKASLSVDATLVPVDRLQKGINVRIVAGRDLIRLASIAEPGTSLQRATTVPSSRAGAESAVRVRGHRSRAPLPGQAARLLSPAQSPRPT